MRSSTRNGWLYWCGSATMPCPSRMRFVRCEHAARNTSGADEWLRDGLPQGDPPDLAAVGRELSAYGVTGVTDATPFWRDDLVAFLLGCSFTFEWALLEAGIKLWHVEHGKNVAMWRTSVECRPAGAFHGPMVVSMRPIPSSQLSKAVTASARFPNAHGAPVHIGDPAALGIKDIGKPDWGDAQHFNPGDVPVFWACGVTPQAVALASKPSFMLTHSPGHMFITDLPNSSLAAL